MGFKCISSRLVSHSSLFLFVIQLNVIAGAQTPVASFSVPSNLCLDQSVSLLNTSTNATSYVWDFSFADLNSLKSVELVTTVTGSLTPTGISIVTHLNNWYAFLLSRDNNKIFRLDFGSSLDNVPTITDLGNTGGLLSGPQNLEFIYESGLFYGILTNFSNGKIIRLTFPSGLGSAPTAQDINPGNIFGLSNPRGLDVVKDGLNYVAGVADFTGNKVKIINFGSSITNNPTAGNVTDGASITGPIGIRLTENGGLWYGFVASFSTNSVNRLDFGVSLSSFATVSNLYTLSGPTELVLQVEGDQYHVFSATSSGNVHHLDLGSSPSGFELGENLGNGGMIANSFGFDLERSTPIWYGLIVDYVSRKVYRMKFESTNPSGVSSLASFNEIPDAIQYTSPGLHFVELTAYSATENDRDMQSFLVQNLTAPHVTISFDNICLGSTTTFAGTESNGLTIDSWQWAFGDGQNSTLPSPAHAYTSTSQFDVVLEVEASNGCSNTSGTSISVYNPPVADFLLPSNNPLCTNQELTFTNSSASHAGSNPDHEWFVNGASVSVSTDLLHSFESTAAKTVTLRESIPGCFDESVQVISTLLAGPEVSFTAENGCAGDDVVFTNTTLDAVTGFLWNFGDLQTSMVVSPTHVYSVTGDFTVALQGNSANGCQNVTSQVVAIHSLPQPDFSLDLPPFSCVGTPSQFNDLTANPTDSNLASWAWSFGDTANGVSSDRNPAYTYSLAGPYDVSLTVSTNFGCSATVQKAVQISSAPSADFVMGPTCLNLPSNFTSNADPNITSWLWKIGTGTYTNANPIHVFGSSGDFSAQLTTSASNGCIAVTTKTVTVPAPPTLDFTTANNCSNQQTTFTDKSQTGTDPVSGWLWDFSGQGSGTTSPAQFTYTDVGTYSVKMTTTHQSGCVYALTKSVVINKTPTSDFIAAPENGPPPLIVQFTNQSVNATAFKWNFGDGSAESVSASPSNTFTALGDYSVNLTATSDKGCEDVFSKVIHVIIPHTDITANSFSLFEDKTQGTVHPAVGITNNGNYALKSLLVEIDISGSSLITEIVETDLQPGQSEILVLQTGIVLRGSEQYVCAEIKLEADENQLDNRTCLPLENSVVFAPYPNPAKTELHLDWIAMQNGSLHLQLINSTGQEAFRQVISGLSEGLNQLVIDLSTVSPGIYVVIFDDGITRKSFRQVIN